MVSSLPAANYMGDDSNNKESDSVIENLQGKVRQKHIEMVH